MAETTSGRRLLGGLGLPTILLCCTTIVSHTFSRSTYGLLLPAMEADLGLTHAQGGLGGTAIFGAYVVGVIVVARVASLVEPITIMRAGLLLAATGLAVLSVADRLAFVLVGLSMTGAAVAGVWITAPTLATSGVAPERRGLVIGLLSSSIGLANFSVGIGTTAWRSAVDDPGAWRPVWVVESVISLALLAAIASFVRLARTEPVEGGFSLDLLRAVPSWLRVTLAYALFGGLTAGFGSFIVVALEENGGLSRSTASTVFAGMGLIAVVVAPLVGSLSDRLGRRELLLASMGVLTTACLSVALGSGWVVALGAVLYGSFAGSFPTLIATYVRDHAADRAFSQVFATMLLVFSVMALLAPAVMGRLADATGSFTLPYLLLATFGGLALALVAGLPENEASPPAQSSSQST